MFFREQPPRLSAPAGGLVAVTWNIAAVNNNPFEYWITHKDVAYDKLMGDVENFIEAPGDRDIPVSEVFSDRCFAELLELMRLEDWPNLHIVQRLWKEEYRDRRIISGFLKDKDIGFKRLASMPDRITNTIRLHGGKSSVYRPTIINHYNASLDSIDRWWLHWKEFMFKLSIELDVKGAATATRPCEMLGKISRSKYPALTPEEEQVSLPLQTLCLAIFDAVMVHIVISLSPDGQWQTIKRSIMEALYERRDAGILSVLDNVGAGADVICLQETAASFKEQLLCTLGEYHTVSPYDVDSKRNQNSLVLLRKTRFPHVLEEVTAEALAHMGTSAPVERGDLLVISTRDSMGTPLLVASFHGDTNGLATKPVIAAVVEVLKQQPQGCQLVFGLDANTYLDANTDQQDVNNFLAHCGRFGLRSCWPDGEPLESFCTTCISRTYLQPQLNKAIRSMERITKADVNPKDHILVQNAVFDVISCDKDNTGDRRYIERECFPSLEFPSDHGIVWAILAPVPSKI